MSNNKQSSIDLFIDQLEEKGNSYEENEGCRTINISIDISDYMELKIHAKAMHKEEIIHAYNQSWHFRDKPYETGEKHYNETFER